MSKRKRILLLGDINSIHLQKWIVGLKNDFEIFVFSLDPIEANINGLENVQIFSNQKKTTNRKGKLSYLKSLKKFRKLHKEVKPDFVHAHYATSYGLLGALLKPKKLFISVWGSDVYEFPKKSFIHKTVFKWTVNRANKLFSTSQNMKIELQKYTSKDINVIPFGIDLALFKKQKEKIQNDTFVIGTIKSLEKIYGIDTLLNVFAKFRKKVPNSKCIIYGKGSEGDSLIQLAKKLKIENEVEFKGFIINNEVPKAISQMDVFCVLSRQESFGVAAVEAAACEIPVIASNIGGLPEVVVNNETGFIVDNDVEQIVNKLFDLYSDSSLRNKMGQNGNTFVSNNYDWKENVETMKSFYIL